MRRYLSLGVLLIVAGVPAAQEAIPGERVITPRTCLDAPATPAGLPAPLSKFQRPDKGYTATIVPEGRLGGDPAACIEGAGEYAGIVCGTTPLDHTRVYAARAWFKITPGVKPFLKLDFYNETGKYLRSSPSFVATEAGEWQSVSLCERGWDYTDATRVALAFGMSGKGRVLVDDPELVSRDGGAGENLLKDGSMEVVIGERLANWKLVQAPGGAAQLVRRTVPVKDGWFSIQLQGTAGWALAQPERTAMVAGKKYTLSGWVRAREGGAQVKLSYFDAEGKYIGGTVSETVKDNQWKKVTISAEPEKYPTAVGLIVGGVGTGPRLDVLFDGFVLRSE